MQITIPDNFIATVGTQSSTFMGSLSGVVTLVLGILLAFFIAGLVIEILQRKRDRDTIE